MKIAIVGAGWLGFPLALKFKSLGHEVLATTTSEVKLSVFNTEGLYSILLKMEGSAHDLPLVLKNQDLVVVSVPPFSRTKPENYHVGQIHQLTEFIPASVKIIYTSSSSVYPDELREARENDVITEETTGHRGIFKAEQLVLNHNKENLVVRLAGLTGYDRFLARHFAGKKGLPNGEWPVNLVHRDDVVEAINRLVLEKKLGIYNICAPNHPSKKDFYMNQCKKYGYELPEFAEDASTGKVVSTAKLLGETEFQYKFSDPFDFQYNM